MGIHVVFDQNRLRVFWTVCVIIAAVLLVVMTFSRDFSLTDRIGTTLSFLVILPVAFIAEYIDSSLGMGYGTTLTPILLLAGFSPLQVVPAVLLSEFVSGTTAGLLHHRLGNVDLRWGTRSASTMWILALCSVVGTVAAVILAVKLPTVWVKAYIGFMILGIGLFILAVPRMAGAFSWKRIVGLGTVAAFNKGISGGGYGPLVTGGQVLIGVPEKHAIGITSLAEGLVCLVGLALYLTLQGGLYWSLAGPLTLGALISVPAATLTVRVLPERMLRQAIGYATVFLGTLSLVSLL
jgi:uncharacterized membrane protein YfcA